MLGPPKPRRLDVPVAVSLEAMVPADHVYRHLEATLDLGFVRDLVKEAFAERGRPSIDPVVFFKLQLVMFFEGVRSERKLVETVSLNLAHRWYLGYALDEELPAHSSLTRIRQRFGVDMFARFFEKVVDMCQEAGLVWGGEFFFDATKVDGATPPAGAWWPCRNRPTGRSRSSADRRSRLEPAPPVQGDWSTRRVFQRAGALPVPRTE